MDQQPVPPAETLERAAEVHRRLLAFYGLPEWRSPLPALDELISTILSQNTNDRNRDLAYNHLRAVLPTWEQVRDADPRQVIEAVRIAGLGNQKGPRIQAVLRQITEECGELDLSFLADLPTDEAMAWLTRFNGVGPKTASIVLVFSLGKPAFPVDTHIYRVTGRIGLRPEKMSVEDAHPYLAAQFPPAEYGPAHLNLIRLGREICHARKPDCPNCPLTDVCAYYAQNVKGGE